MQVTYWLNLFPPSLDLSLDNTPIIMSAELVSMDNDTLRQRVVMLEKELEASKTEAINHHGQHHSPEAHKKAEHAHHVSLVVQCMRAFADSSL